MVTKTLISAITGVLTGLVCLMLGIDFAFFWGALAFLLNFVPNVGSIIAVIPPALIALLQFGDPGRALATAGGLTAMQMVMGNVVEPKLLSQSMSVSALVVFVSMLFWGWLWGLVGVVLSVPLTVAIKIVCAHVDALKPVAVLLGGEPERPIQVSSKEGAPSAQDAPEMTDNSDKVGQPESKEQEVLDDK